MLECFINFISEPCWKQLENKGGYPSGGLIKKSTVTNKDDCLDLCEEDKSCKAALLSPSKECNIVTTDESKLTDKSGWSAAIKKKCAG